jgi:hypothetical protein
VRALAAARCPTAGFVVFERDDPDGIRLQATVDIDDADEVMDLVMDALYDVRVERGPPVYVITGQPFRRTSERL